MGGKLEIENRVLVVSWKEWGNADIKM